MTGDRAKVLGRTLIGISEGMIDTCCEDMFDISSSSIIAFEEFQMIYFELFNRIQTSTGGTIDFENLAQDEENAQLSTRHMKANEGSLLTDPTSNAYDDEVHGKSKVSNSQRQSHGLADLKKRKRTNSRRSLASLSNLQELWKTNGSSNRDRES